MAKNYPGTIVPRGERSYRIIQHVDGEQHRKTIHADSMNEAIEEAVQWKAELLAERDELESGLSEDMPMSKLLDAYKEDEFPGLAENTRTTYQRSLDLFEQFFTEKLDDPMARKVRSKHVKRYLRWRRREFKVSTRTLEKDYMTLHRVFEWARTDVEVVGKNPVSAVTRPDPEDRDPVILDHNQDGEPELERLLAACEDPMLRMYVLLLADTGLRCESEALWLQWKDIDLDGGFIYVAGRRDGHRTKSGKSRWVPIMTRRLREALAAHKLRYAGAEYKGKTSPWVFHHPYNRRRAKAGQRIGSLRRGFNKAVKRAGLPSELNQHDLRHRACTRMLNAGIPVAKVQKIMGHAQITTTMGYAHLVRRDLEEFVDREGERDELKEFAAAGAGMDA